MNNPIKTVTSLVAQIDGNGCAELPFVQDASQTYFNYLNGASGYIVFIVGGALLLVAMVSRKTLGKVPGWLAGIVIVALALGSMPVLLPAFGINLGCGGTGTTVDQPAEPAPATTPAAPAAPTTAPAAAVAGQGN